MKKKENTTDVKWSNYKYYLTTLNSIEKRGAELIDVTDQK